MMTIAPLPNFFEFIKIFKYNNLKRKHDIFYENWKAKDDVLGFLTRSSWAIALISKWKIDKENRKITIWIPDFFCESALVVLRKLDVVIKFYNVNEQLIPDQNSCIELAKEFPPDIVLFVHYFGIPQKSIFLYNLSKKFNSWLIEDATHSLKKNDNIGSLGDFILYSPYKHLPIPDCSILLIRKNGPSNLETDFINSLGEPYNWFKHLNILRKKLKISIFKSNYLSIKWLIKKSIQKFGFYVYDSNKLIPSDPSFKTIKENLPSPNISIIGLFFFNVSVKTINKVGNKKIRNIANCDEILLNIENIELSKFIRPDFDEWVPYFATYKTNFLEFQNSYNKKLNSKLPIMSWPDLPEEVFKIKNSLAVKLKNSFIHLPIHNSINDKDYYIFSNKLNKKCKEVCHRPTITEIIDEDQWSTLLSFCENKNLLQTWQYGEAKLNAEGYKVQRLLFQINNKPIALFQKLNKSKFLFNISIINKGPLFFENEATLQNKKIIFNEISRYSSWRNPLIISPNLNQNGENVFLLKSTGFYKFTENRHESIKIDLNIDLDNIRKNLNPKWRNMLNNSEKKDIDLEITNNVNAIKYVLDLNIIDQSKRKYKGISRNFTNHLIKTNPKSNFLTLFSARANNKLISAIILYENQNTVTYFIGWNNEEGRIYKSNYFLIWQAIIYYKNLGFKEFDLGGIDQINNPNVSYFKLGLGGNRYNLIGDYLKWL